MNKDKLRYYCRYSLIAVLVAFKFPFYLIGRILFHWSKLTTALAHFLMFNFQSAKDELRDFWSVKVSIGDVL